MPYLDELVDRLWRIAWSCAPVVVVIIATARANWVRPAVTHAGALGIGLAMVVPFLVPTQRQVVELQGAGVSPVMIGVLPDTSPLPVWVVLVGAAGVAVLLVWRWRCGRVQPSALEDAGGSIQATVATLAEELGVSPVPRVAWARDGTGPSALWSLRGSWILLPRERWEQWSDENRESALLHELAHLRRRDVLGLVLWGGVFALYWWNPLVWWLRRVSDEAVEMACDRWVTAFRTEGRSEYARFVLSVAAGRPGGPSTPGVNALAGRAREVGRRLRSIMREHRHPRGRVASVVSLSLAFAFGAAFSSGSAGAFERRHVLVGPASVAEFLAEERDVSARREAVDAIGLQGPEIHAWAVPTLTSAFSVEDSASVRCGILDALGCLSSQSVPPTSDLRLLVTRALQDNAARVRQRARDLANQLGDDEERLPHGRRSR